MCYDIKTSLESQLRRAEFLSDETAIKELKEKLAPFIAANYYHVSGYAHPNLLIYPNTSPNEPVPARWGLIPHWVKDNAQKEQFWNATLNARGETIFEKPSFRASAQHKRCVLILEGFYEHHHFKGKTYPFFIQKKNGKPMYVAGLWSEWLDKETGELVISSSIVTTRANKLLAGIHNNPKLKEPRMPVILKEDDVDKWLAPDSQTVRQADLADLIKPFTDDDLLAHTVRRLRGKEAVGNIPEASEKFSYPELEGMDFS